MYPESFLKSINSAIFWRGFSKLSGLAKHVIIAGVIGLSAQLDSFFMMMALLGILVLSWGEMVDIMAVPHMVQSWQKGDTEEFKKIASGYMTLTLLGSLLLASLIYFFRDKLPLLAIGFETERGQLLIDAVPWLLPAIIFYIPFRHIGAVLRAKRQFSPLYQAEFLLSLATLLCVGFFNQQHNVLFWSYSLGIMGAFLYLLVRNWRFFLPLGNPFSLTVRQSLVMAPGLFILQSAQYVYVLTDQIFVSFLPTGMVSALFYATILIYLLPSVIGLDSAFITVISEQTDKQQRTKKINDLLALVIFFSLGATLFILVAGKNVIAMLLERGLFTTADTQSVAIALMAYSGVILPSFLNKPFDQIFQVERKIGLIVRRTVLGFMTNLILNSVFLFIFHWGLFGIALSTSISYWVMLLTSLQALRKIGYPIDLLRALKWGMWLALFLAIAYFCCRFVLIYFTNNLVILASCALLVAGALFLAALFYQGEEKKLIKMVIERYKTFSLV
ncbi:lipid II flippase MurJ [Candidatus Fukatsuia symbiotica]|uniref:Virulence factor MviN n=1 Tax=Candidatus Fukatsuia symbiotica TaxID=1878942 RepID=A0A2U8I2P5_9GAMM|nr:lipid II flippase MurJ [Candidatus Fukatsuia symbiotica]AWK13370.1 virulence factor MviN [Candidatus Fukatsuia symbiotica]MEA9444259.1 lipid II flippase MurJ [Candidatus Fukatsuia symbiotica]